MTTLSASKHSGIEAHRGPGRARSALWWCAGLPALVMACLMGMYFSGVAVLENIVGGADMNGTAPSSRREFGLMENIQNLTLLAAAGVASWAGFTHAHRLVRGFMLVVSAGVVFLLLEEVDYGLHWYELLAGVPHEESATVRNWHNGPGREVRLKTVSTAAAIGVFLLLPLAVHGLGVRSPWVRYFTPLPAMALTLVLAVVVSVAARELQALGLGRGLEDSLSEFRETVMYWLGLCYVVLLARRVPPRGSIADSAAGAGVASEGAISRAPGP